MIICKVVGHVWATKKEERLNGMKLMVVQEDSPDKKRRARPLAARTCPPIWPSSALSIRWK